MKQFFLKKKVYTVLFLMLLTIFTAANVVINHNTIGQYVGQLKNVKSFDDLGEWMDTGYEVLDSHMPGREVFVEAYSTLQKLLNKKEFNNFEFIMDDDGALYYGSTYVRGGEDLAEYAKRLVSLKDYVSSNNSDFFFVMAPCKIVRGVSNINRYFMINDPNNRMDMLLSKLQQRGVHTVDCRLALEQSGASLKELFYTTDHYWTSRGAFEGAKAVIDDLEDYYGERIDADYYYRDINNYDSEVYKGIVLGSDGKRIGVSYCGTDDFVHIWPKNYEESDYTWIGIGDGTKRRGNLRESLYLEEKLIPNNIYEDNTYRVYIDQMNNTDTIINHNNPKGLKLAVLRDSYFSAMAVFMAPVCSRIDMYKSDSREATKSFLADIEQNDYDYVIYEVYPYNLERENFLMFD